jgi:hypothetical protein
MLRGYLNGTLSSPLELGQVFLQGEEDEAFEFLHCQDAIDSIEIISLTGFLKEEEGF